MTRGVLNRSWGAYSELINILDVKIDHDNEHSKDVDFGKVKYGSLNARCDTLCPIHMLVGRHRNDNKGATISLGNDTANAAILGVAFFPDTTDTVDDLKEHDKMRLHYMPVINFQRF